jgi:hypothetical protein
MKQAEMSVFYLKALKILNMPFALSRPKRFHSALTWEWEQGVYEHARGVAQGVIGFGNSYATTFLRAK